MINRPTAVQNTGISSEPKPRRPFEPRHLDTPHLHHLADIAIDPVFIIGPHRSGTTILQRCLMATGCFNSPTVYDILYRRALLHLSLHPDEAALRRQQLVDYFASQGLSSRGYDNTSIGPELPEEYGEVLDTKSRWRLLTDENLADFLLFARKIQFASGPERVLLLKNPWDTMHFMTLAQMFPAARFVFIHRSPLRTIDSQIRVFASLLRQRNEYEALLVDWYRELFRQPLKVALGRLVYAEWSPLLCWRIVRHVARCSDYMLAHRSALGERAIDVTYDELCARPRDTMGRVLDFLALVSTTEPDYAGMIRIRNRPLLPLVARTRRAIERRTRAYAQAFGV